MSWLEKPALALNVTIRTMTLSPDAVADHPSALCRYIGRKTLRPMSAPQEKQLATMATRATGSDKIAMGAAQPPSVAARRSRRRAGVHRPAARLPAPKATDSVHRRD